MASANPGLHKMDNNPMSVQYPWEENAEGLQRWKNVSASCGKCALDITILFSQQFLGGV